MVDRLPANSVVEHPPAGPAVSHVPVLSTGSVVDYWHESLAGRDSETEATGDPEVQ